MPCAPGTSIHAFTSGHGDIHAGCGAHRQRQRLSALWHTTMHATPAPALDGGIRLPAGTTAQTMQQMCLCPLQPSHRQCNRCMCARCNHRTDNATACHTRCCVSCEAWRTMSPMTSCGRKSDDSRARCTSLPKAVQHCYARDEAGANPLSWRLPE